MMDEIKLDRQRVNGLIAALEGNSEAKVKWLLHLHSWCNRQDKHIRIQSLIKQWLDKKCRDEDWHKIAAMEHWQTGGAYPEMEWMIEEETIDNFIHRQMEYTKAFEWDDKEQKVIINKYMPQPRYSKGKTQELLDYLNEKMKEEH